MTISLLSFPVNTLTTTTTTTPIYEFSNNPKTLIHIYLILNPKIAENVLESSAIILPGSMDYALAVFHTIEEPDKFTFACILKTCSRTCALKEGEQIHAQIVKFGYELNGFVQSTLIHLYAKCGKVDVAHRVFNELPERRIISWNAMFLDYLKSSHWEEIVILFQEMLESNIGFDEIAYGRLGKLDLGE